MRSNPTTGYAILVDKFSDAISSALYRDRVSFDDAQKALREAWHDTFTDIAQEANRG